MSRPTAGDHESLGRAFRLSLAAHAALFVFILIKSWVFPGKPVSYIPTLRVDLVGLPDVLKKDLIEKTSTPQDEMNSKPQERSSKEQAEKAAPDEMVTNAKTVKNDRSKRNLRSLERLKALAKIEEDTDERPKKTVKGNVVSRGSSLSSDARESGEPGYYDLVRDRLQDNWELNPLLARQNLNAQARIWIDAAGKLRQFTLTKSSGNSAFDAAVKRAVESSAPFPKPPREILSRVLLDGVSVGFPL